MPNANNSNNNNNSYLQGFKNTEMIQNTTAH